MRATFGLLAPGSFARWRSVFLEYCSGTIAIGCIAQISVAPLILKEFGTLQVLSPFSTLAVAWFLPLLLLVGLVIVVFSPLLAVAPELSRLVFTPIKWLFSSVWIAEEHVLLWLTQIFPTQVVWEVTPTWLYVVWWGSMLCVRYVWWLCRERKRTCDRTLV